MTGSDKYLSGTEKFPDNAEQIQSFDKLGTRGQAELSGRGRGLIILSFYGVFRNWAGLYGSGRSLDFPKVGVVSVLVCGYSGLCPLYEPIGEPRETTPFPEEGGV